MELDKRIKEGKRPLTCFDLKEASDFVNKTGYFANEFDYFSDLSKATECCSEIYYGKLYGIKENKRCVFKYLSTDYSRESSYRFFIPEDWVLPEEKKYRPYTLAEWIDQHEIGEVIHYRNKSEGIEFRHMYMGYAFGKGKDITKINVGTVTLGVANYSFNYLFEDYEIEINGEWRPFGVLDE